MFGNFLPSLDSLDRIASLVPRLLTMIRLKKHPERCFMSCVSGLKSCFGSYPQDVETPALQAQIPRTPPAQTEILAHPDPPDPITYFQPSPPLQNPPSDPLPQ